MSAVTRALIVLNSLMLNNVLSAIKAEQVHWKGPLKWPTVQWAPR